MPNTAREITVSIIQMVVKPSVFCFSQPSFHFIISLQGVAYQFTQTFFHNFCMHSADSEVINTLNAAIQAQGSSSLKKEKTSPFALYISTNQLDWPFTPTSTLPVWKVNTHFIWNINPSYSTLPCHSSPPIGHLMIQVSSMAKKQTMRGDFLWIWPKSTFSEERAFPK